MLIVFLYLNLLLFQATLCDAFDNQTSDNNLNVYNKLINILNIINNIEIVLFRYIFHHSVNYHTKYPQ